MCRRSIGFWNSIDGGIISRVMKSHAAHMCCHSSTVGRENGERVMEFSTGGFRSGNANFGRSRSHSEYCEALSVHL